MGCQIGFTIYSILEAVAFVFIIVGTPIDQFRQQSEDTLGNKPCLTLWGMKNKCYSTTLDSKPQSIFSGCPDRKSRFMAAEAMSIVSILVYGLCLLLAICACGCCSSCGCCLRVVIVILTLVGIATGAAVWGCMANSYNVTHNICPPLSRGMKYGAGFALILVAWILHTINLVMALLPC